MPGEMKAAAQSGIGPGDHVYLIDGSGYIFRAFHALPPLTRKSDGLPTGAIAGFCNMLHKLLREMKGAAQPTHLAVVFDSSEHSFRNDIYRDYKAHRPPAPEALAPQFPLIREAVRAFNVACVELLGYEADDIIATYAGQAAKAGAKVTIVSSDKDLMQLVGPRIDMLDTMKNKVIREPEVFEKFGVTPDKVIDVQALAGDATDNVPGVRGIGIKTAAELINRFGSLDALLASLPDIAQVKRRESLEAGAELARVSRQLVTLKQDVPVPVPLGDCSVAAPEAKALIGFLRAMELSTLTKRVAEELGIEDISAFEPDTALAPVRASPSLTVAPSDGGIVGAASQELTVPFERARYKTIVDRPALDALIARAFEVQSIGIYAQASSSDAMRAELIGLAMALGPNEAFYIPVGHRRPGGLDLGGTGAITQLPLADVLSALRPLLAHPGVLKTAHNIKCQALLLARCGVEVAPIDDTLLMSYVLAVGQHNHGIEELAARYLHHQSLTLEALTGTGKSRIGPAELPIEQASSYCAEAADIALRLAGVLKPQLSAQHLLNAYETLERPLVAVLLTMERAGILVDRAILARLSHDFSQRMGALEDEAYRHAGERFNLGSPKQLGEILFDKLGLAPPRKTKTGSYATDADVLEALAAEGHDLPRVVLDWRQLQKLKGTYTDALPAYIHPQTGRVHTSFALAATSTGRLSSSDPNLQNIPIRTNEGRAIRTAFIAPKDRVLMSADYSQIELRVLAHIAEVPALRKAFEDGLDIHAMTASEMFGVPVAGMDPAIRRRAKAINFGIIYGISAFGLANQLSIPRGEAQTYIDTYFKRFPGIRDYMEQTKAQCRREGFVNTLFGRRINMPLINSKNPSERAFVERAAINAPIQGTAADIIRRAMIRIPDALSSKQLSARMLLQVHDELVFELSPDEAEATKTLVKNVMEKAGEPAIAFAVPIVVDAKTGPNWDEAH